MIMKFGTGIKLDALYTMATKKFVTSLLLRSYDVMTRILRKLREIRHQNENVAERFYIDLKGPIGVFVPLLHLTIPFFETRNV